MNFTKFLRKIIRTHRLFFLIVFVHKSFRYQVIREVNQKYGYRGMRKGEKGVQKEGRVGGGMRKLLILEVRGASLRSPLQQSGGLP